MFYQKHNQQNYSSQDFVWIFDWEGEVGHKNTGELKWKGRLSNKWQGILYRDSKQKGQQDTKGKEAES